MQAKEKRVFAVEQADWKSNWKKNAERVFVVRIINYFYNVGWRNYGNAFAVKRKDSAQGAAYQNK
jgi:predicted negative regulator of RcsB-dependent stress response